MVPRCCERCSIIQVCPGTEGCPQVEEEESARTPGELVIDEEGMQCMGIIDPSKPEDLFIEREPRVNRRITVRLD